MRAKKISIVVLSVLLMVCMSCPTNADLVTSSKVTATIDAQLQTILQNATSNKTIPVDIWLYETNTQQEREQEIHSKIGLNKTQIALAAKNTISAARIDEYIMTERELYAAEREAQYNTLKLDYASIGNLQETRKTNARLFYSQYAPMISAELTTAEIKQLARDNRVQSICYSPDVTLVDEGNVSFPLIGANYTRDTLGYTGAGIKIGMIERFVPNSEMPYLASADITYDDVPMTSDPHPNMVASILVGQTTTVDGVTYKGIVPDAQLYATCYAPEIANDWRVRIEWLIAQGVHIINMSAYILDLNQDVYDYETRTPGSYSSIERWIDHIANSHHIYFVNAAGNSNDPEKYITYPGMAYNIITVGSLNDGNSSAEFNDVISNTSCYVEADGLTNKPDLVAPGVNITTAAGTNSGTSFAAPHVTGVIAQLCQRQPSLRTLQAGVKAILTASISHSIRAYDSSESNENSFDQYGAGVVNARASFETANAYRMSVGNFSENSIAGEEKTHTFSTAAGQRVRVSLTWLMHTVWPVGIPHDIGSPSFTGLSDLDLCVIDPDGVHIECADSSFNNTEIVDFIAPKSGTYQMVVTNFTPSGYETNYAIAWWFE